MSHKFHSSILRAYDIRGIYGKTLYDSDAYHVGKSFATVLIEMQKKKVSVGYDGRVSSPALKSELIRGLTESGIDVTEIGVGPTPMLYFSVHHLQQDAGIMVTGSHNPKDHNGFKIFLKEKPFYGQDIQALANIANDGIFFQGEGKLHKQDISDDYIAKITSDCTLAHSNSALLDEIDNITERKHIKIAWDAGNGATAEILKKLTNNISAEHILLFDTIDATFPNHHPDPTVPENLIDLQKAVVEHGCDLGIAFDGDGDRIGVVDNNGKIIWGDNLMVFYAREILQQHPNSTIIADVKASNILFEEIQKAGGKPLMWKTGHSLIKAKMKETKAVLAGEMSGHIFFADKYYGYDDALYAAIRLINIVVDSPYSLAKMHESLPKSYSTPEIRIDCADDKKFQIITDLKLALNQGKINFNDVDGIRVDSAKGWWLIRASNTQAALVARCDGASPQDLLELKSELRKQLQSCNIAIPAELN